MKTKLPILRLLLSCSALALGLPPAGRLHAQTVPPLVNYQGRVANPDGTALATGDYQLTFRVYDSATIGGGLVWGPQIFDGVANPGHGAMIPVVQGYFNVMLGPLDVNGASLANAFTGTNRFVEITVSNHNAILPRQQILTAPFAFQAANSEKLAGADWGAVFGTNDPVNGRIPVSKLATNGNILAQSVGIRINNPAVPLDVLGRIRLRGDNASASAGTWLFDTVTGTDRAFFGMNGNGIVGFMGNAGGGWGLNMNVTNGNVGVGTASPSAPLHVLGPGGGTTAILEASPGVNSVKFLSHNGGGNYGSVLQFTDGSTNSAGIVSVASGGLRLATAGTERLIIDGAGNIGLGTSGPYFPLHLNKAGSASTYLAGFLQPSLADGNFDMMYLGRADATYQCGSLQYVYNASTPSSSRFSMGLFGNSSVLNVLGNGNVGIGTTSPQRKLEVNGDIATTGIVYVGTAFLDQNGLELGDSAANGTPALIDFHFGSQAPGLDYNVRVINDASEQLTIYRAFTNSPMARFNSGGLRIYGAASFTSDRNMKENFVGISLPDVLNRVLALPISQWNYKQDAGSTHFGPMAQDFFAAFHLGPDDKQITTGDESGVALAAIQGLNQKLEATLKEKDAQIERLKEKVARIDSLEERLNALERCRNFKEEGH